MNDWLDYQGSGSSRAYTNDTLSHAAPMKNTTSNGSGSAYDNINKKLDAFYAALQKNMSLKRQAFTMVNSFAEKARETKSKATLAAADTRRINAMYGSLISDVDSFSGSQLQKTALKNKFDRMVSNYETQLAAVTRTRTDFNTATLDTLVDEIMSNDIRIRHSYDTNDMSTDEFIEHAAVSRQTNGNAYDSLNAKLDQLYKSTQDLINVARNLRTSYESMISAARNAKKNLTLAEGKYKMWETAYNKIDSDIDAANISDMQKTALRNKLERILSGAGEISKINTGGEIDMNADTFNNIISSIQNAMRR